MAKLDLEFRRKTETLTLPAFELLRRQPDPPHVARTLVETTIPNRHGVPITYRVEASRRGTRWWISATLKGLRVSNTLTTTSRARAEAWLEAVRAGRVAVGEDRR